MSGTSRFLNSVSIIAVVAAIASPALAAIETVTVTAERREVDLQKTTLSATVLSGDDLLNKSVMGLTALQYAAPGIQISDYGSANVFNMRGVGREAVDVEIPSGVAIYRDGVPTLAGYFQNEPYYDMAGIEVLRGPQGTLAGQSASGGALFIKTRSPDLNGVAGYIQAGVGDWDSLEVQGAINLPLGDDAAARFAIYHDQRGSWYNLSGAYTGHPATRNLINARASIYWHPTAGWDITLKTDFGRDDFGGNPVSTAGAPLFTIKLDDPMAYVDKSIRQVADIRYTFGDGTSIRSLTGFQNISTLNNLDANGSGPTFPVPAGLQTPVQSFKSQGNFFFYSQEFDIVSASDQRFRWVLGAFGERQVSLIPDYSVTGQDGFTFTGFFFGFGTAFPAFESPWKQYEDDVALFANTEYDITPELTLETGLRASYNHKRQHTEFKLGFGFAPVYFPFLDPAGGTTTTEAGDYLDGKVALQWKPNDTDFAYVTVARGHTVKGINIFPPHDQYRPVEVWNYEVGYKTSIFDDHMRIQTDAYYENIGNYQAVFGFTTGGGGGGIVNGTETRNAETRSKIWGVELGAQGNWDNLSVDLGFAYLNSKLGTYSNVINEFSVAGPGLGNAVAAAEAAAFGDANCQTGTPVLTLTGSKAPFSPDVTANAGMQYKIHTGVGGWSVTPRADVSYTGVQQADLFKCSLETIRSRTLVNLQMRVDSDDSPWWASLWVTNVGDQKYVAAVQNIPPIYYAGPRRQFGIRIGRSF